MVSNIFDKSIQSNKKFWSKVNEKDDINGCLLYEMFYAEPVINYGISKTALSIAKIKGLKPICITGLRGKKERFDLINSMSDTVVGNPFNFFLSSLKNSLSILRILFSINNKKDLINLTLDKYHIGPYIYDTILRVLNLTEANVMTFSIKKVIILELGYFYLFKGLLKKYNLKTIVLGDNVYRCGLLFELAKHNSIECITPINLNNFSMRKYEKFEEFNIHYRKPELNILDQLSHDMVAKYNENYFKKRFSANLEQHDVLKAFSNSKNIYSREELVKQYNLKTDLPIIGLMAHIFCDAPHAYPDTLYDDHKEWIVSTVKALKKNNKINFLIKEHPSFSLYNEDGVMSSILKELNCEKFLLKDDVHSLTILNEFDVVITCGGTIGQEFTYKGKPVVLGAKPPYSGFGFTEEPKNKEEYEGLLESGIEKLPLLSQEQKNIASKVMYYDFVLLDNYSDDLEIGGQRFYMGRDFDYDKFYEQILLYNKTPLEDQKIYKILNKFIKSDSRHILNNFNG
jgi:hypothetical protein